MVFVHLAMPPAPLALVCFSVQKSDVVSNEFVLLLPAACLLIPTTIKPADYSKVMTGSADAFGEEKGAISLKRDFGFEEVVPAVVAVFRSFIVQKSDKACILFARSFAVRCVGSVSVSAGACACACAYS